MDAGVYSFAKTYAVVLHHYLLDERAHPMLKMVLRVIDAPLLKPRFGPSPQALDWVVGAGVASVKHKLDSTISGLLCNPLRVMDP